MIDLSTDIAQIKFQNPTILASGILGLDCAQLKRAVEAGAAGVTLKSLTIEPRRGHNNPIFIQAGDSAFMNAVGYANKGIEKGIDEFKKWDNCVPLIGSIVGGDSKEFAILTEKIIQTPIKAVEIVLSCPHTPGFGMLAGQGTPEATTKITRSVRKKTKLPIFVKLSPSIEAIGEVARAAEEAGANAINMGNTLGPGMKIDIDRCSPILAFKVGGVSGPAIKPIMIRCVFDLYKAVKIPIIATGGITTGEDAIEALMAGATAVEIGTAIYIRGISVFKKINQEMSNWMEQHNYKNIQQLIGLVHKI